MLMRLVLTLGISLGIAYYLSKMGAHDILIFIGFIVGVIFGYNLPEFKVRSIIAFIKKKRTHRL